MTWDAISAVAEVISVVAVFASLIYVGVQIRQGNQLASANTYHNTNVQFADVMAQVAGDGELANIYRRVKLGEDLEPVDLERYSAFLWTYFAFAENVYIQQESGLYNFKNEYSDIVSFMAPHINRILSSNQAREWLRGEGKELLSPSFYEAVERYVRSRMEGT